MQQIIMVLAGIGAVAYVLLSGGWSGADAPTVRPDAERGASCYAQELGDAGWDNLNQGQRLVTLARVGWECEP